MNKSALVMGGSGQDGSYLIDFLIERHYRVHAQSLHEPIVRTPGVQWHVGDMKSEEFIEKTLEAASPDELYNLAAMSRPAVSWSLPFDTTMLNAVAPQRMCEWLVRNKPNARMFQASSSEIFGNCASEYQNELTALSPISPYAMAKAYAHQMMSVYRSQFGLHASSGILFNHESPRRPLTFVSQKIAHAAAAISIGLRETEELDETGEPIVCGGKLRLGNIHVCRDFGFAGDVVAAMHLIVSNEIADDYIIGTGQTYSIADFCKSAFGILNLDWKEFVVVEESLTRKNDIKTTRADSSKLTATLGWKPKVQFEELVAMMVHSRLRHLTNADQSSCKKLGDQ